jgi:hypothetical protein
MMDQAIRNSLLWRLWTAWLLCWRNSRLCAFFRWWADQWHQSATGAFVDRRLDAAPAATASSRYVRCLRAVNRGLNRLHFLYDWLQDSLLYRIYAWCFRVGRGSKVFGWLFRSGLRGMVIFALAMYVPLDYILRDTLAVPVLSSTWDELLLVLAVAVIVKERIQAARPLAPRATPLETPMLLFLGLGLALMFAISPYFSIAVSGYRATCQYMLWFLLLTRLLRSDRDFLILYVSLVVLAFVISLHGIYQYIVAVPIPSNWVDQAESGVRTRVYSIFGSPNIMGDFMLLFAPMAAALAYWCKDRKLQVLSWIMTLCMCFACLFTMSRGAWMGMAVAILVFALLNDRRLLGLMVAALCCSMLFPFVSSRIGYLFTDEFAASTANGGRASRWALGMSYLYDYGSPLFGLGLGMFGGAVAMQHQINKTWMSYFYMDNYYRKILVEMGWVGLACFLFLMAAMVWTCGRAIHRAKRKPDNMAPLASGMLAGLCGVLTHCYFENIFEEPYMMAYFWAIAAMVVYIGFLRKEKPGTQGETP